MVSKILLEGSSLLQFILYVWIGILGLAFGSFINVCIYRIPRGDSIITPSSKCPICNEGIFWKDNIPVISYILLKGKCRACGGKISIRYPVVELTASVILFVNFIVFGLAENFIMYSVLFFVLLTTAFIDYNRYIVPNKLIIFGSIIGLTFSISNGFNEVLTSLIGAVSGGLTLYIIRFIGNKFIGKESMGWGDVKLGGMIGIFLGFKLTLISIYFSFLITFFYGIFLIIRKKRVAMKPLPYGTFLSIGVYITVFYGEKIYNYYLNYFI